MAPLTLPLPWRNRASQSVLAVVNTPPVLLYFLQLSGLSRKTIRGIADL
jgi:hypothetical protein